jgi:Tfp pilus assembly protein PilV
MQHRILTIGVTALAMTLAAAAQQTTSSEQRDDAALQQIQGQNSGTAAAQTEAAAPAPTAEPQPAEATQPAPAAEPTAAAETQKPAAEQSPATPATAEAAQPEPQLSQRPSAAAAVLLPTGTAIRIHLNNALSTKTAAAGSAFSATVYEDVKVDGHIVIASGSTLTGRVTQVGEPRRIQGRPWIELRPESVTLADGRTMRLSAIVVDTTNPKHYDVTGEGRIKGPSFGKQDKILAVSTGSTGAIAGTILGGPEGALIGMGGAAGYNTGRWLIKHHSMVLPQEMGIVLEVSSPLLDNAEKSVAEVR